MKLDLDLFRRLCETPGIPGREERVRELIEKTVLGKAGGGLFDESHVDRMGSLNRAAIETKGARGKDHVPTLQTGAEEGRGLARGGVARVPRARVRVREELRQLLIELEVHGDDRRDGSRHRLLDIAG